GLLAVLNEHRQIVALNDSFLQMLGIDDPSKALGLRQGFRCVHAHDEPAGCGTTKYCSTCGAAIAIVSSLGQDESVEKICTLTANRGGEDVDIALLVKSHPIEIDKKKFLLIFLQDITQQEQRAALERAFFHDVNNMLSILVGASQLLIVEEPSELANTVHQASLRLAKEVAVQRFLSQSELNDYLPVCLDFTTGKILEELHSFLVNHPVAIGKKISISENYPVVSLKIDISLLLRVLYNMIINALEATAENGKVKIWLENNNNFLSFCVWNKQEIPQDVSNRIFQRNFSTKEQAGRGIGTYSMKLLGEKILGGKVSFTTSKKEGTIFRFTYPV
ncbi:MAG: sensor histidine kinase, partial [Deltaproteobacteria bacterium]|nr:sensor histidine kinase [Deltaproteobacteria bacterium]